MSVASLLAGLFPPSGDEIWDEELIWQPIPIHSVPANIDRVNIINILNHGIIIIINS